jgi:hypothetical protein
LYMILLCHLKISNDAAVYIHCVTTYTSLDL